MEIDKDRNGVIDKQELIAYMLELTGQKMEGERIVPVGGQVMSNEEQQEMRDRFDNVVSYFF